MNMAQLRDICRQYIENVSDGWHQRQYLLRAWDAEFDDLKLIDTQIDANLEGLAEPDFPIELLESELEHPLPGDIVADGLRSLELGDASRILRLASRAESNPKLVEALCGAFAHSRSDDAEEIALWALGADHPVLTRCAAHRLCLESGQVQIAHLLLSSIEPNLVVSAARSIGRHRLDVPISALEHASRQHAGDPSVAFWSSWAKLRIHPDERAARTMLDVAMNAGEHQQLLCDKVVATLQDDVATRLADRAIASGSVLSMPLAACAGLRRHADWIVEAIRDVCDLRTALAFRRVAGIDLNEFQLEDAATEDFPLGPHFDGVALRSWWAEHRNAMDPQHRHILGRAVSPMICIHSLVNGPQADRLWAKLLLERDLQSTLSVWPEAHADAQIDGLARIAIEVAELNQEHQYGGPIS